ncbi:MAG: FtsX-like permease family protein [Simkaniaceae bacterium]
MMSVVVISLVVWLVLIFLSVTEGIEQGWMKKLTSLNAPIRISPTREYFHSYYHQIDTCSYASGYASKSLGEKLRSKLTNPFDQEFDSELPSYLPKPILNPDGSDKDLIKELFKTLDDLHVTAQDYEITGALLRLKMIRPELGSPLEEKQRYLTQVSYLSTFPSNSHKIQNLIEPPSLTDINHLFALTETSFATLTEEGASPTTRTNKEIFQKRLMRLIPYVELKRVTPSHDRWRFAKELLSCNHLLTVQAHKSFSHILITEKKQSDNYLTGSLYIKGGQLYFNQKPLSINTPLFLGADVEFEASIVKESIEDAERLSDIKLHIKGLLQNQWIEGVIPWRDVEITDANVKTKFETALEIPPFWAYRIQNEEKGALPDNQSVILPRSFRDSGVLVGDRGYFSFGAMSSASIQEMRQPFIVAGFYDPGVMSIGAKYALASPGLVHDIAQSNHSFSFPPESAMGIQVWFDQLGQTKEMAERLSMLLKERGLLPFFKITPFYEYDFARDLLQQFQSDRYLFTLIGAIILFVACTNIVSLLILLVNDKKVEIGILRAMGASSKSIASIFALSGVFMGVIGSLLGIFFAFITLKNIDSVVSLLSFLQGHDAFNAAFYDRSLPNQISKSALTFILISTPVLSLIAGAVPAIKAARLSPAESLRS